MIDARETNMDQKAVFNNFIISLLENACLIDFVKCVMKFWKLLDP